MKDRFLSVQLGCFSSHFLYTSYSCLQVSKPRLSQSGSHTRIAHWSITGFILLAAVYFALFYCLSFYNT